MNTVEIDIATGATLVTDLTSHLVRFCDGFGDGLVNVFVPHATAGVALMETGSGSETDLERAIHALLPRDIAYRHSHGSAGHGGDHLLPVFVSPAVTIPVLAGMPALGVWQRLVLVAQTAVGRWGPAAAALAARPSATAARANGM
jgi:secondary thiamine-phosphate synthase enzyme